MCIIYFLQCERLKPMFLLLEEWSKNLNYKFTVKGFIYGPKYKYQNRRIDVLIHFVLLIHLVKQS